MSTGLDKQQVFIDAVYRDKNHMVKSQDYWECFIHAESYWSAEK